MEVGRIKAIEVTKATIKEKMHGTTKQVDQHRECKVLYHLICVKDLPVLVINSQGKKRITGFRVDFVEEV